MSLLRDRWGGYVATTLAVFTSGITIYLLISDTARRSEINRRKNVLSTLDDECSPATTALDKAQQRFGILRVGGRFVNPFDEWREQGAWEWAMWKVLTMFKFNPAGLPSNRKLLEETIPLYEPDLGLLFGKETNDDASHSPLSASWSAVLPQDAQLPAIDEQITYTWLGQSCTYVQIGKELSLLTDPIFGEYLISPLFGEKRLRPAPLALSEITKLDIILVSHNHFDHLEDASVRQIGNSARWYIPLGMKKWFNQRGIINLVEMAWWQECPIPDHPEYFVAATPAMHWSARHPFHTNTTLWNSYVVVHRPSPNSQPHPVVFHAGDTGYVTSLYSDIASVYGSGCELALMPIGSYCPRWHLRQQHCDPQDVVKMHLELGAKKTVGVHYATWILSDEHYLAPQTELGIAAEEKNLSASIIPGQMGRTVVIPWERVESSEEESRSSDELGLESVLTEARGGKCVIWR